MKPMRKLQVFAGLVVLIAASARADAGADAAAAEAAKAKLAAEAAAASGAEGISAVDSAAPEADEAAKALAAAKKNVAKMADAAKAKSADAAGMAEAAKSKTADAARAAAEARSGAVSGSPGTDSGSTTTPPSTSSNVQKGFVNVRIQNIKSQVAREMKRNESEIPTAVTVPMGVAARACEVPANELARRESQGDHECEAKRSTMALNQAILQQLRGVTNQMGGEAAPGGKTGSTGGATSGTR